MDQQNIAVIVVGAPGCGKGTNVRLAKGLPHSFADISTGEICRQLKKHDSSMEAFLASGKLVPDEKFLPVAEEFFPLPLPARCIFDGIPRTEGQTRFLLNRLASHRVCTIYLNLPDHQISGRLINRGDPDRPEDKNPGVTQERILAWQTHRATVLGILQKETKFSMLKVDRSLSEVSNEFIKLLDTITRRSSRMSGLATAAPITQIPPTSRRETSVRLPGGRAVSF